MPQFPFTNKPDPNQAPVWTPEGEGLPDSPTIQISNAIRGLVGMGDDSKASRFGELMGATIPFASKIPGIRLNQPGPAVKALVKALSEPLAAPDMAAEVGASRMMGNNYHTPEFVPPKLVADRRNFTGLQPGRIVTYRQQAKNLKFEMPEGMGAPTPRNAREASLVQEGYVPGFGQSPKNLEAYEPWREHYARQYTPTQGSGVTEDIRHRYTLPNIQQQEPVPSVKGLQEVGDVTTTGPKSSKVSPSISGRWSGSARGRATNLTDDQVRAIRKATGTTMEIAKQHGVNDASVRAIRKKDSFYWVKD